MGPLLSCLLQLQSFQGRSLFQSLNLLQNGRSLLKRKVQRNVKRTKLHGMNRLVHGSVALVMIVSMMIKTYPSLRPR
ncbi:hypothetical protein Goshw_005235 [Gossypium schwendimanii]|uniref:Uncharacterized protein n=1 Tax=Gossypium schwendimanii TaxID=34291 RepID=A0A7J9L0Y2_GOSSC|nr:hypothetical protein [Gossypium schwendimanii]